MLYRLRLCSRHRHARGSSRRLISGILVKVSGMILVWASSRQATVTHSSTESEYIAADTGAGILVWLSSLANELRIPIIQKTMLKIDDKMQTKYHEGEIIQDTRNELKLLVDNKGAHDIANGYEPSKRTKHLDVRHHYIQEKVNQKQIKIIQVPTTEQQADFLTKPVSRVLFKKAMHSIGFSVS